MALRNMLVRVGADVTGFKKGMNEANTTLQKFSANLRGTMGGLQGIMLGGLGAIAGGLVLQQGVEDAMKYEAQMALLSEVMGESRKDFEKWAETVGSSMAFSRLESADLASKLSLNFKQIATDQKDLVKKTTRMMEIAGIVANKRGMTMQEVSDRIRSAMNMEADGADEMGVDVRIASIQMSKAYKEMADGKPWDKLTTNQRKAILYEHILDEVTTKLGATIQDTTQLRMGQFTASLQDVRMALGQAFLPILYQVLPYLTKFMQGLYKALQYVHAFTRALFGGFKYKNTEKSAEATEKQASAMGDLANQTKKAGKAGEKAKGGLAGFDEINLLPEKTGGGGGGADDADGGAIMEEPFVAPPTDASVFEEGMNAIVKKMQGIIIPIKQAWNAISGFITVQISRIRVWWEENGAMILEAWDALWGAVKPILMWIVKFIWDSIKGLVEGIITFFMGLLTFFGGLFTGDLTKTWEGLKQMIFGAVQAIWNFLNLTLLGGIRKIFFSILTDGTSIFLKVASAIKTPMKKGIDDIVIWFKKMIADIKLFFTNFGDWWIKQLINIGLKWFELKTKVIGVAKSIWDGIVSVFKGSVNWFMRSVITPLINSFERIKDAFSEGIGGGLKAVFNEIRKPINNMIDNLNGIKNAIPGVKSAVPNIPHLPRLAEGGIATRATLAVVGEGRQDEAIAPIDKLQSYIANAVLSAMRATGGGGKTSGDITLNLDGRTVARLIKPHLDREQQRIGGNVRYRTT